MDDTSLHCCVKRVLLHAIVHPAQPWMDMTKPSLSCTWVQRKLPYMLKSTGLSRVCILWPSFSKCSHSSCPSWTTLIILPSQKHLRNQYQSDLLSVWSTTYTYAYVYIQWDLWTMVKHTQGKVDDTYWGIFHPLYTVCKNGGGSPGLFYHMDEANVLLHKRGERGLWIMSLRFFLHLVPGLLHFFLSFLFTIIHRNVRRTKNREGLRALNIWMTSGRHPITKQCTKLENDFLTGQDE